MSDGAAVDAAPRGGFVMRALAWIVENLEGGYGLPLDDSETGLARVELAHLLSQQHWV